MQDTTLAYIAGFLDGDGSVIFQLKPRPDYVYGFQIKVTVSFYQKQTNRSILEWLREQLEVGAVRDRVDGIGEYDIEGLAPASQVLELLKPYVVLKRDRVEEALRMIDVMELNPEPSPEEFLEWAGWVESFQSLNYTKKRKYTRKDVYEVLVSKGYLDPRND